MDIWDKRRRNIKVYLQLQDTNATALARKENLSVNTLSKFLRKETKQLRWGTLEKIASGLGLANVALLDLDNPFSDAKNKLYEHIESLSDEEAEALLDSLRASLVKS